MNKDYYDILGIQKTASVDELKKAYRKLARQYHPDVNEDPEAEGRFKEISEAYAVLSDPQKRRQYDQFGYEDFRGRYGPEDIFRGFDFDIFHDFGFDLNGIFDLLFGGRRGGRRGRREAIRIDLTLKEIALDRKKKIRYKIRETCPRCSGSGAEEGGFETCSRCNGSGGLEQTRNTPLGYFRTVTPCPACNGKGKVIKVKCEECDGRGYIEKERETEVKIPHGISDGQIIELDGIYGVIRIVSDPNFKKEGNDLYTILSISVPQAVLGEKVSLEDVRGENLRIDMPSGTQSGSILRVRGRGLPAGFGRNGDLYVRVMVKIPQKLSKDEKRLFQKLKALES